jgi:starch synthase|tara:strand:+ start:200 stop:1003 length:804 start_codon:yes stop_codon:yes gene_type:complete
MKDKRVLIISPEVVPYLPQTEQAINSFKIPKSINDSGGQIRIFTPRYGLINERRHQLHEVIRLSGMNLVINDMDTPLIIKVASIPKERMQVYFIDNEDYFKRRAVLRDNKGNLFSDNDERMIFFTKGVIETVKKLNWSPDIIHLQGWFTSLFPLYLKTYFKDDAIFSESKIVCSIYPKDFDGVISKNFKKKVEFDGIPENEINNLSKANYQNLTKLSIDNADAFVMHSSLIDEEILEYVKNSKKPFLSQIDSENEKSYVDFYKETLI